MSDLLVLVVVLRRLFHGLLNFQINEHSIGDQIILQLSPNLDQAFVAGMLELCRSKEVVMDSLTLRLSSNLVILQAVAICT